MGPFYCLLVFLQMVTILMISCGCGLLIGNQVPVYC